jgi:hypothetical protein
MVKRTSYLHDLDARQPIRTASIPNSETSYGDSPRGLRLGEKSAADMTRLAESFAKSLRRSRSPGHPYQSVAATLDGCRPHHRCGSCACPQCGKAGQRRFIARALRRFKGQSVLLATVVLPDLTVPLGQLNTLPIGEAREALRSFLHTLGLKNLTIYGGLDISLNVSGNGEWASHWSLHWCLLVSGVSADELRQACKGTVATSSAIMRPVMVRQIRNRRRYTLSYAVKPEFWRRTTYRDSQGKLQRSRPQRIPAQHRCELLHYLHTIPIQKRIFWRTPS